LLLQTENRHIVITSNNSSLSSQVNGQPHF